MFLSGLQWWFFISQEITRLEQAVGHLETVLRVVVVVVSVGPVPEEAFCRGQQGSMELKCSIFLKECVGVHVKIQEI